MSDFSRFRTAVGGFSRTDVVNYIEETSAAHQKALRKLEDEKQAFADRKTTICWPKTPACRQSSPICAQSTRS